MKKVRYICIMLMGLFASSCTQNNGNIGDWFGTWRLDAIEIDGQPDASYSENMVWKFQSDIIQMIETNDALHIVDNRWGTWSQTDDILTLDFAHVNNLPDGTTNNNKYIPFKATYLPYGVSHLQIVTLTGKSLVLKYLSPESVTYTYYLRKW